MVVGTVRVCVCARVRRFVGSWVGAFVGGCVRGRVGAFFCVYARVCAGVMMDVHGFACLHSRE